MIPFPYRGTAAFAITGLELGVAISQAHVSTILTYLYMNDATNLNQNGSTLCLGVEFDKE